MVEPKTRTMTAIVVGSLGAAIFFLVVGFAVLFTVSVHCNDPSEPPCSPWTKPLSYSLLVGGTALIFLFLRALVDALIHVIRRR